MNFKEKLIFYDKIKVSDNIIDNPNEIGENIVINIKDYIIEYKNCM